MRSGRLVRGTIGLCSALALIWSAQTCDHATTASLSEEARVALEVGCRGYEGRAASECRSMLKRLYLAGSLDPERTLRAYCDSVKTARWGGSRPPPPQVCVQRYGGWQEG